MQTSEGSFINKDGRNIFWKAWDPSEKPKALLHIIHGYAEHVDRYKNVVDELVPAGYAVLGTDHQGHGRSDGKRCHVNSFMDFIADEKQFREQIVKQRYPGIPYIMLGHSMGSIIAMNYAEIYPEDIDALVLSGTGAGPGDAIPSILNAITRVASKLLPSIHVKSPLPADFISRDPEVVKAYVDDPMTYDIITPRLGEQLTTYNLRGAAEAARITMPTLIQFGTRDNSFSGQNELYEAVGAADKTIKAYEGLKHEVYNELIEDRKIVLSDLHQWLDAHV